MTLVTGATGLVGSHLLLALALRGEKIVALKRKTSDESCLINVFSTYPELYNTIQWVEGDILNLSSLQKAIKETRKVYHCAGMVSYDPAESDLMMKINIHGTETIVKLCIDYNIEKLCYVSSVSAINRINEKEIIDENTDWRTSKENSNYAISKYKAEQAVREGMTRGLKAVIVNPTIIIGPGNWKTGSTVMFQQIWEGLKFYTNGIAGFVDVRDVCEAMIRLMNSDIYSERFILNAENLPYKKVFDWMAHYLVRPKPSIQANALLLNIAWRMASLKKILFDEPPFITKETALSGMKKLEFCNWKIKQAIDMHFLPIHQSVKDTCAVFLKDHNRLISIGERIITGMDGKLIYGIQQVGIGVDDADKAFEWYATKLGADILIFDDENEATYMAPYTGGKPHKRRAILAMNSQGGSGIEIWQYLDRKPGRPATELHIGDLGINFAKFKTRDALTSFERLRKLQVEILSEIECLPNDTKCFYIKDPYGNILQINEYSSWYSNNKKDTGGICGCTIGVSDIDCSLKLYSDILGYNKVIYDSTNVFEDLTGLPNGRRKFRRMLLAHENNRTGGFSKLLGESQIELIQSLDGEHKHIYRDRYWGDIGFIHVCFDIWNMDALVNECEVKGFPFKVLSNDSFKMGQANGYWGYIEDKDGTLIEFVETHKVPLIKKLNWNINLRKRDPNKALPGWLIKAMSINRVTFSK